MFTDFIDKYRNIRQGERDARDKGYEKSYNDAWSYFDSKNPLFSGAGTSDNGKAVMNWLGILGSPIGLMRGLAQSGGTAVVQGLDNVGRGANDFFSAWAESMNGGHGKIKSPTKDEILKEFNKNVTDSTINVGKSDDVDFTKTFNVLDKDNGNKRTVEVGYKKDGDGRLKIATIYDSGYDSKGLLDKIGDRLNDMKQVEEIKKYEYYVTPDGRMASRRRELTPDERRDALAKIRSERMNNKSLNTIFGQDKLRQYFKDTFNMDVGKYDISDESGHGITYSVGGAPSLTTQYDPKSMFDPRLYRDR